MMATGLDRLRAAARGVYGGHMADALKEGLQALANGKGADMLYTACESLPEYDTPTLDPQSDDDRGPISSETDFDDVTAAWTAGKLTDAQYQECLRRAGAS
jgi:hypothetical protein